MKLGEVCLLTNDVVRLADFYRKLLEIEIDCDDPVHQTIIDKETMLTVYNDGIRRTVHSPNICLAFTVEDIKKEYEKLVALGVEIAEKPAVRPWGAINMSFYDPDGNVVYLRSFSNKL